MSTSQRLVIEVQQPAEAASKGDWAAFGPSLITLLVAIVGWTIVERFARARERRGEIKALVGAFSDAVSDVTGLAVQFYKLDGGSAQARTLAPTIRARIATLSELIEALAENKVVLTDSSQDLKSLRQTVTGGTFESLDRPALEDEAPLFVQIAYAGAALSRSMQLAHFRAMTRPGSKRSVKRAKVEPRVRRL